MTKWVGSLINRLDEACRNPEPEVGMGATEYCYSDRHAYTIIEITKTKNGKASQILVQKDDAKRTDNYGMSDAQSYEYIQNHDNRTAILKLDKKGHWKEQAGNTFGLGHRDEHYDYSF